MAGTSPGVEPRPFDPERDEAGQLPHFNDSLHLAPRRVRDKSRFVHPAGWEDGANVWRFVISGEAFTTEALTQEQLMEEVDRVFTGETNPTLPTVTYEWVSINDEQVAEEPLDGWEDDGGSV